jgi:hypothetical protein
MMHQKFLPRTILPGRSVDEDSNRNEPHPRSTRHPHAVTSKRAEHGPFNDAMWLLKYRALPRAHGQLAALTKERSQPQPAPAAAPVGNNP